MFSCCSCGICAVIPRQILDNFSVFDMKSVCISRVDKKKPMQTIGLFIITGRTIEWLFILIIIINIILMEKVSVQ